MNKEGDSKTTSSAVIRMALTDNREEENKLKQQLEAFDIHATAIDFGGEFVSSIPKIIERATLASEKDGIINGTHAQRGAVAGATHEAISQLSAKAIGLNVGGKISIARYKDHLSVCIYFGVGLMNLNEIAIGLGHRAL